MISFIGSFAIFFLLFACSKQESEDPADPLQSWWTYTGMQDTLSGIFIPVDSLKKESGLIKMDIVFRKIGFFANYEFEGQSPVNLFWGTFKAGADGSLHLLTPYHTSYQPERRDIRISEQAWMDSLLNTQAFKVEGDSLYLQLTGHHRLVYYRSDRAVFNEKKSMGALVDGLEWSAVANQSEAQISYDTLAYTFALQISTYCPDTLANGRRYQLSLFLNQPPLPGIYAMNNEDMSIPVPGAAGRIYGWMHHFQEQFFNCWSDTGQLVITHASRTTLEGYFDFHATATGTIRLVPEVSVVSGNFKLPLNSISRDWFIPYRSELK